MKINKVGVHTIPISWTQRCSLLYKLFRSFKHVVYKRVSTSLHRNQLSTNYQYLKALTKSNLNFNSFHIEPCVLQNMHFDHGTDNVKWLYRVNTWNVSERIHSSKLKLPNLAPICVNVCCTTSGDALKLPNVTTNWKLHDPLFVI